MLVMRLIINNLIGLTLLNARGYTFSLRKVSHKVFAYGTLKRNEPNHYWLTKPENGISKFVSEGRTKTKYPLVVAPKHTYPFLLQSPGNGNHVKGEIYEVDDKMLDSLDKLESHPHFYVRELDDIIVQGKDEAIKCWVYFQKKFDKELMKRPMLESFSFSDGHGLKYTENSRSANEMTPLQASLLTLLGCIICGSLVRF